MDPDKEGIRGDGLRFGLPGENAAEKMGLAAEKAQGRLRHGSWEGLRSVTARKKGEMTTSKAGTSTLKGKASHAQRRPSILKKKKRGGAEYSIDDQRRKKKKKRVNTSHQHEQGVKTPTLVGKLKEGKLTSCKGRGGFL